MTEKYTDMKKYGVVDDNATEILFPPGLYRITEDIILPISVKLANRTVHLIEALFESLDYFQINAFVKEYGIKAFPCKELTQEEYFKEIENALKITLSGNQKLYLLDYNKNIPIRELEGLYIRCIKLALSDGEPINYRRKQINLLNEYLPEYRNYYKNSNYSVYNHYEVNKFLSIWTKLKEYGFKVRELC